MWKRILCLNSGSSSVKMALFRITPSSVTNAGTQVPRAAHARTLDTHGKPLSSFASEIKEWLYEIDEGDKSGHPIDAVGHRVVHGGIAHTEPLVLYQGVGQKDNELNEIIEMKKKEKEEEMVARLWRDTLPLAPLHSPGNRAGVEFARSLFPDIPQVAAFDTCFHVKGMDKLAWAYGLPKRVTSRDPNIRKFGFHGLSYQNVVMQLANAKSAKSAKSHPQQSKLSKLSHFPKRMVVCHLGSGASLCAIEDGRSIDTTMGFSPLEGVMMGTRTGDIDPSVLWYILRNHETFPEFSENADLEQLVNKQSGLLGLAGESDMRALVRCMQGEPVEGLDPADAVFAVEYFCRRVVKAVGAMKSVLSGPMDALVFTGGIGENQAIVREMICAQLSASGVIVGGRKLEPGRLWGEGVWNYGAEGGTDVLVVHTQEEGLIALRTAQALGWIES